MADRSASAGIAHSPEGRRTVGVLALVLLAIAGLAAVAVWGAGEILEAVGERDGVALWDRPVLDWAIGQRSPGPVSALLWFTNTGGPIWQPIIMAVLALFLWWRWRNPTPFVLIAMAEVGAVLISSTAKRVVDRARPPQIDAVPPFEVSPSFPSGHTMQAFAAATIIAYLLIRYLWDRPRWLQAMIGLLALAYACLMGFSRVFLGYHWLTDVLAAAMLGIAWSAVVIACHRVWLRRSRSRPRQRLEHRTARSSDSDDTMTA